MRIALFAISILLFLAFWPMNEAQRQAWNHFWAIRSDASQEEKQTREEQTQQQYNVVQRPLTNDNFNHTSMDDLKLYRLQKKALGGPFGETQFEYMLRRW